MICETIPNGLGGVVVDNETSNIFRERTSKDTYNLLVDDKPFFVGMIGFNSGRLVAATSKGEFMLTLGRSRYLPNFWNFFSSYIEFFWDLP